MTRGRKKDLTLPPTRALTQQRDYRYRKAHYIASLEMRCQKAEAENFQLRQEVAQLKASSPATNLSFRSEEMLNASQELLDDLNRATTSLQRFRTLSRPHLASSSPPHLSPTNTLPNEILRYRSDPQEMSLASTSTLSSPQSSRHKPSDSTSPVSPGPRLPERRPSQTDNNSQPSQSCCYGWVDCNDLIESDDEELQSARSEPTGALVRSSSDLPYFLREFAKNPPAFPENHDPRDPHRFH